MTTDPTPRVSNRLGILAAALGLAVSGCDSGPVKPGTTVYSSPEEVNQKNQELKDAMKGGAYGSAGRKSAGVIQ